MRVKAEIDLDDVDSSDMCRYIAKNYAVDDIFSDNEIIHYASRTLEPEEVFSVETLEEWARFNTI